jgi:hypothetical protein
MPKAFDEKALRLKHIREQVKAASVRELIELVEFHMGVVEEHLEALDIGVTELCRRVTKEKK